LECQLSVNDWLSPPTAVGAMQYNNEEMPSIVLEIGWLPIVTHVLVDDSSALASLKLTAVNSTALLAGEAASPIHSTVLRSQVQPDGPDLEQLWIMPVVSSSR